ncbi:MAG: hypothetical protein R6U64_09045 [Bacteroidales bacterium]
MKRILSIIIAASFMALYSCTASVGRQNQETMGIITQETVQQVVSSLIEEYGPEQQQAIKKGVNQVAAFWLQEDGSKDDFKAFCQTHYKGDPEDRRQLFEALSGNYEVLWGHMNQISLELNKPLHLDVGPIKPVDILFGGYAAGAHLSDDFFSNKIAFLTILNFPFYSLEEKAQHSSQWDRQQWAYARMGDVFTSRVPAGVTQEATRIGTESDNYISEYNIMMGKLISEEGEAMFPEDMALISHWGLRDEIKSNYGAPSGLDKQRMIYQVMTRIINQDIPRTVINNPEVTWNPYTNIVYQEGQSVDSEREPETRYQHLLNNFHAMKAADEWSPSYPTAIQRAFDQGLELSMQEVESLFTQLVSWPGMKDVGALISQRLGRPLEPFDIWYDGFKARSSISEEKLNRVVRQKYPTREAFEKDLPQIMVQLGWQPEEAQRIASKIVVESSRGAGHAWGAQMRAQNSHLRTRIGEDGMDYKGYNIAIHEFGHNVEQTISLHDVDYYMMAGVPNTAFTEALAFVFQTRDLKLLDMDAGDPLAEHLTALDKLWGTYEIMGVSLVDMKIWEWMYANPEATPLQLREETTRIAKEVWNQYYAPVFGVNDSPILAIYSHMISYPLYLSAYPLGHLIEFQIENHIRDKDLATEVQKMFAQGRLIPQQWMTQAVGNPISNEPMFEAVSEALRQVK